MDIITLKIEGMHCSMCESHICDDIRKALPNAKKVKASHLRGQATFLLEKGVDETPAIEKIEKDGYRILGKSREEKKSFFHR